MKTENKYCKRLMGMTADESPPTKGKQNKKKGKVQAKSQLQDGDDDDDDDDDDEDEEDETIVTNPMHLKFGMWLKCRR